MIVVFVYLLSIIAFLNAILHLVLLFGAPLGEYVLGGKYRIIPKKKRFINAILFLLFAFLGTVYLQYMSIISIYMPKTINLIIIGFFAIFFAYGIIGNLKFTKSKKERNTMTPVCIVSLICSIILLISIW